MSTPSTPRRATVLRNAFLLIAAQVIVTPLSVLVNAVSARTLGAQDFGRLYLITTFSMFAFLLVEWGQQGTLTGKVAIARERAGELLGSALSWRIGASILVSAVILIACRLSGYDGHFLVSLALLLLTSSILTIASACQDALRGFERTDFAAATYVGWQLLTAAAVIPTLLLGGGLQAMLTAQVFCATASTLFVLRMLPRMQIPKIFVRASTVRELVLGGRAFLMFAIVMQLQPLVDAAMLAKFAAADAVGWHGAARKLIGLLVFPASALIAALYPTLCRLHIENQAEFKRITSNALHLVAVAVVPIALGCALFPNLGVAVFGERAYGPVETNLRILSIYVLLVYFSMPVGTALTASGRQLSWALVQFLCVLVSVLADPPLILWFQAHTGNGGLGVCVATVISEVLMVGAGLFLLPKDVLDKTLLRKLGSAAFAGGCMALTAFALHDLNPFVSAPLAVLAYAAALWATRGIESHQLQGVRELLRRS